MKQFQGTNCFTEDGGDSLDDDWPGEPSESYWRQQLDQAEQDLRQVLTHK